MFSGHFDWLTLRHSSLSGCFPNSLMAVQLHRFANPLSLTGISMQHHCSVLANATQQLHFHRISVLLLLLPATGSHQLLHFTAYSFPSKL